MGLEPTCTPVKGYGRVLGGCVYRFRHVGSVDHEEEVVSSASFSFR